MILFSCDFSRQVSTSGLGRLSSRLTQVAFAKEDVNALSKTETQSEIIESFIPLFFLENMPTIKDPNDVPNCYQHLYLYNSTLTQA